MPELNYNLSTGISPSTLLNVKLDTQERMNDLEQAFNIPNYQPPNYFIPKDLSTDSIIKGDVKLPTIDEALDSKDPKIVEAALNQMRYKAASNPMSRGVGFDNEVKYQEGQNKFTENHWWKENNQTMYGFNPYKSIAENEDFLHHQIWDNYSTAGKAWRGVGTFAGRTLSKLVTGLVGTVGDIGAMTWNGLQEIGDLMDINNGVKNNFWDDVSNNWLSRKMEEADQYTKQSILPTYKTLDYDNKGAWNKLFDPYTLTNSFADGAGFLLQFAVPGAIFGKLAQAGKIARGIGALTEAELAAGEGAVLAARGGMTVEQAKNISGFTRLMGAEISDATKLGKYAGNTTEFLTGSKDVGGISAHLFNTSMEAVAETKEGFNSTVKDLMDKGMSREKAVQIAGENAPGQFWVNMGILTASNAFENKLLQKALGNREFKNLSRLDDGTSLVNKQPTTLLGDFFKNNTWGNRISYYGKNSVKASIFEGYWEENAQTAAQRWARGEYTRKGDDTTNQGKTEYTEKGILGFIKQLRKQTIDSALGNDREAADSIMAGVVIGVLGGTAFAKISGERKTKIEDKANLVAKFINTRDAWLSLDTLSSDIYNQDGTINKQKAEERAKEISEKLDKIQSVFKRTITADQLIDPQQREMLQHKVFGDYVKAHIMNGTEEALIQRLQNWNKKDEGELSIYGVTPEMQENGSQWASIAEELVDKYDSIKDIKYATSKDELLVNYLNKTQAVKSLIFDYITLEQMSKNLAGKYQDLKDEVNPLIKFPFQQEYNEKHAELLSLKQLLNVAETPIEKQDIQLKIDNLEKEQKERKKTLDELGETKEDVTGFLFPKDVDPKKEFQDVGQIRDYLSYKWYQTAHEDAAEEHNKLVKQYSDPKTGLENYNKVIDYWSKKIEEQETKVEDDENTKEYKERLEILNNELEELNNALLEASTEEEKDDILNQIQEKENEIALLNEEFNKDDIDTDEDTTDDTTDDTIDDVDIIPTEIQYGVEFNSEPLAHETPFKTANSETRDSKDKEGNLIYGREFALPNGYDHALSEFVKEFAKSPEDYEAYIIGDTDEFIRERYSDEQYKKYQENNGKPGAIVVFTKKGGDEWLRFEDINNQPIIAFSYNAKSFEDRKDIRAQILADKSGRDKKDVLEFYTEQQKIADNIRATILADRNLQIPVKASLGSLGIFPETKEKADVFERFKGFHNNVVKIVKDVNDFTGDVKSGDLVLEIPKDKTDSGLPFYIPVIAGNLSLVDNPIGERIHEAVQAINYTKFDTKEEAQTVINSFLNNLYYVDTKQFFKAIPADNKFRIVYYRLNDKTGKTEEVKVFTTLKLKLLDSLYSGTKKLQIYKKDENNKFTATALDVNDYKSFIHSTLTTKRKLITLKKQGKGDVVYTKKVNAYLNLVKIGEEDENITTDEVIDTVGNTPIVAVSKEAKAIKASLEVLNTKNLKVDEKDNTYYYNIDNPSERYLRVSTLKGDYTGLKSDSADRGNIIDSLLRDFVSGKITSLDELSDAYEDNVYKDSVGEFTLNFLEDLHNIFKQVKTVVDKEGIELISSIPTLWGTLNGKEYAGSIDLLGIKKDGSVFIIDLKTSSRNRRDEDDEFYEKFKEGDTTQQSAYAELLFQRTGIRVKNITIFPIQVVKEKGKYISAIPNKDSKGKFTMPVTIDESLFPTLSTKDKKADIERRRQEELETTKNIGEDKLKEGRENTKKIVESLKQRYPTTSVQGIIIRILEKLIDFSKYSTIIDSDYLNSRNASGQATWFGMMISQETLDGILEGKEFEVHTFIHEFIHGFTTSKISDYSIEKKGLIPGFKSNLTAKEKNAIEQLQRIFEKVKRDNPKSKEYGFTNLDEFIAEAFSNSSFQYTLKNTKAEGKKSNLFSEFVNAIGDLLFEQLERWAKRFNKEIPQRNTITGILEDVLAWTEDLIDQNNKLAYIATNEEINAKYDTELKALEQPITSNQFEIETKKADIERRSGLNGVEEIIFSNPNFRLEGFEIDGNYWNVVTSTDRAKVLVNINGVIVPFYLTTGQAGKGLVPGWYPFFGIGKDGWLNKTDKSDMETYYERYWGKETADIVKSISEELNSFYGTNPSTFKNDGDPNATSRPLTTLADKVEDYINSKLNYTPAINNADARKTLRSNVEQLGREINAKYDAELATLEQLKKESTQEETKEEIPQIPENVGTILEEKKKALEDAKKAIQIGIDKATSESIRNILKKKGDERIAQLEKEISKLEELVPKEDGEQSPLEQLRTEAIFSQPLPVVPNTTTLRAGKKEYEFDFDNNKISPNITKTQREVFLEALEKAHAYTSLKININDNDVYLIKYNKSGKFVILNSEFKNIPENKEMLKNKEYKNFKECK